MLRFKLFTVIIIVFFLCGIATLNSAVAGEKIKWHGTGVTTKFEQIEVGDEDGHVLAIMVGKQVFINEKTGERTASISVNTVDMNPKAGLFIVEGYGVSTAPNGDKLVRRHEGKAVGKGQMKGTFTWVKGTGQWENIKGGGTWESWSLAPDISYYEVEDIRE